MSSRPPLLTYSARDGIAETHFPSAQGYSFVNTETLNEFVIRAIRWSIDSQSDGDYCILDSFLSDTVNKVALELALQAAKQTDSKVRILLLDPRCRFARARAHSLGGANAIERSKAGLEQIAQALESFLRLPPVKDAQDTESLLAHISAMGKHANLELRFYEMNASGPILIFHDIALLGRYGANQSSKDLPWNMVVRDRGIVRGLFSIVVEEFDYIWEQCDQRNNHRVFLSYNSKYEKEALKFCEKLSDIDNVKVAMSANSLESGDDWREWISQEFVRADEVIVLAGEDGTFGEWGLMEIGAAWSWQKRIVFCLHEGQEIPGIVKDIGTHAISTDSTELWPSVRRDVAARAERYSGKM